MINITKKALDDKITELILKNTKGFEVHLLNYGATLSKVFVKDNVGNLVNVVLSYSDYTKYFNNGSYAGATIGPTSGRIAFGKYSIDGITYQLSVNNGNNANHGGTEGLSHQIFDYEIISNGVIFRYRWPHLKGNHVANVDYEIMYTITEDFKLNVKLNATSDRNANINLTNHSYFNLSGNLRQGGEKQFLKINANEYTPVNENMIPTGEKRPVDNSAFDFRKEILIEEAMKLDNQGQFEITRSFDHGFVLDKTKDYTATLYSDFSGIELNLKSTNKVLVVYTGNYLDDVATFDFVTKNPRFLGVALEAQNYQNGINIENFEYNLVNKENPYFEEITYEFKVRKV